ncbi:hypothetical protein Tco_1017960 [Tanacetum coccineum]|uniref:Uncharacterized protein n=1 Tax=Tanacetum coccineum TaxID=301880 RepID=A0ABQ5FUD1_9ASTR
MQSRSNLRQLKENGVVLDGGSSYMIRAGGQDTANDEDEMSKPGFRTYSQVDNVIQAESYNDDVTKVAIGLQEPPYVTSFQGKFQPALKSVCRFHTHHAPAVELRGVNKCTDASRYQPRSIPRNIDPASKKWIAMKKVKNTQDINLVLKPRSRTNRSLVFGLRLFKTYDGGSPPFSKAHEVHENIYRTVDLGWTLRCYYGLRRLCDLHNEVLPNLLAIQSLQEQIMVMASAFKPLTINDLARKDLVRANTSQSNKLKKIHRTDNEKNLQHDSVMIIMKALEMIFHKRQCQGLHSRTALSKDGTELCRGPSSDNANLFPGTESLSLGVKLWATACYKPKTRSLSHKSRLTNPI